MLTPPSGAATTFTWDANGNTLVQVTGSARTTYTWDGENRLLGVLFSNGQRETYSYAADGLRRKKVDTSGLQYLYVWDEEKLLLWTDQSFNFQNQYTQYPGQWGGLVSERHASTSFFYGEDLQASIRFMAQVSGSITDQYLYKAFGEQLAGGSNFNPYRYVGRYGYFQEQGTPENGMRYYVQARHLRVDLGRWVSRDPMSTADADWNRYRYVASRATLAADPSGEQPWWLYVLGGLALAGGGALLWRRFHRTGPALPLPPVYTPPPPPVFRYTYVGCSVRQQRLIEWAMAQICSMQDALDQCLGNDPVCCQGLGAETGMNDPDCFSTQCNRGRALTFYCSGAVHDTLCARVPGAAADCAAGPPHDGVALCTDGTWWRDPAHGGTTLCPPLVCILAHELIHGCGKLGHRGCFHCVCESLPGCATWRPVCGH